MGIWRYAQRSGDTPAKADDIPLLRRFAVLGPRYATAAEAAIKGIEER